MHKTGPSAVFHSPGADTEGSHVYCVTLVAWPESYTLKPAKIRSFQGTLTPQRGVSRASVEQVVVSHALSAAGWSSRSASVMHLSVERNRRMRPWWRVWGR